MGFFSSIGSFISSVASGIGKICSGIASTVTSVISSLGNLANKAVSSFFGGIANKALAFMKMTSGILSGPLGPILGPIITDLLVQLVVKVISKIAEESGVVEKGEKTEEIGYRLEEAEKHEDWKKRDNFGSFREYYSYLKEQIPAEEIDYEKLIKNLQMYTILGMQAELRALEEKFGLSIPKEALIEIGRSAMKVKEVAAFIRAFDMIGCKNLSISEYLKGQLPAGELERITNAVLDALKFYFPEKSENDLSIRLNEMRKASEDDKTLVKIYKDEIEEEYGEKLQEAREKGEITKDTEEILKNAGFNKIEASI